VPEPYLYAFVEAHPEANTRAMTAIMSGPSQLPERFGSKTRMSPPRVVVVRAGAKTFDSRKVPPPSLSGVSDTSRGASHSSSASQSWFGSPKARKEGLVSCSLL
jgi:hypothetical protein